MTTGLALSGGGARGAYQAGALSVLLPALAEQGRRPEVLSGASVGALNATAVAATAHLDVAEQVDALVEVWSGLRKGDVLRPFATQVPVVLARYLRELTPLPGPRLRGFIDTEPLRRTVEAQVDFDQLAANVGTTGPVRTLVVMATEVVTGAATAFVAGDMPEGGFERLRALSTVLRPEHLVASASIPLLFSATRVDHPPQASGWYCDGSTRLTRPVTPLLDAGADDLVVVSSSSLEARPPQPGHDDVDEPDLADVVVNVLDAMVGDVLADDLERCRSRAGCLLVAPRDPLAIPELAREVVEANHRGATSLLRSDYPLVDWALGAESPRQAELLSYLLFDPDFLGAALELGAEDARRALSTAG